MANDEKDRFGDKLRDAERAREDSYFAQQDQRLIAEARRAQGQAHAASGTAGPRCPTCDVALRHSHVHGVESHACPRCQGMWLARGSIEELAGREDDGWIARWLRQEFPRSV